MYRNPCIYTWNHHINVHAQIPIFLYMPIRLRIETFWLHQPKQLHYLLIWYMKDFYTCSSDLRTETFRPVLAQEITSSTYSAWKLSASEFLVVLYKSNVLNRKIFHDKIKQIGKHPKPHVLSIKNIYLRNYALLTRDKLCFHKSTRFFFLLFFMWYKRCVLTFMFNAWEFISSVTLTMFWIRRWKPWN